MSKPQVLVAGGGPSGLAAAVASARNGASTLLVERYGFLGGMATAGLVNPFMSWQVEGKPIIEGIFQEIINRLKAMGGWDGDRAPSAFDPECFKLLADDMCRESGVSLLLHSLVVDAQVENGLIASITVANKSGLGQLDAEVFVDATGDADLAARCGVPCQKGRPEDGLSQPMTLCFRMAEVDIDRMPPPAEINQLYEQAQQAGEISNPREDVQFFFTTIERVVHFNTTRVVKRDGTDPQDLTDAELTARQQVQEMVRFLQARISGFENSYLQMMAPQIGVRETRRIVGEYVLTEEEVLGARKFPDVIARGSYPVDIHNPAGTGTVLKHLPPGESYDIPYRCLIPKGIDNLLVTGRPISATHEAHSSLRIMPICIALGQAAGTAAALCAQEKVAPPQLAAKRLQAVLLAQGANLGRTQPT